MENWQIQKHGFGVNDEKGREIGALVRTGFEPSITSWRTGSPEQIEVPPFYFHPWATRAGKTFGAIKPGQRFATEADRAAAISKYLDGARKRAEKIARAKYGAASPEGR